VRTGRWGVAGFGVAIAVVSTVSAFERAGLVPLHALAATPRGVAAGRVWLLATNALVADDPLLASLLSLVLVGGAALAICGPRLTWTAAAAGHLGSTMLVYLGFSLARLLVPGTFDGLLDHPDYGVSAALAAWIGAGSAIVWQRRPAAGARMGVVAFCLAAAAIGWTLDSNRTALDADHVIAFAIGIGLAAPQPTRVLAGARARLAALVARPVRSPGR
jgi:hypothetical protein